MTEDDVEDFVRGDEWMMRVLAAAEQLGLPDWWIGAGFLRNAVWDHLSGLKPRHDSDVDLVYFDALNRSAQRDWDLEDGANDRFPFATWEVRNQARMHELDGFNPYSSTSDGIAHWVETATCVGVRSVEGALQFLYCWGAGDLLELVARPTPPFREASRIEVFRERIARKRWTARWPRLRVEEGGPGS